MIARKTAVLVACLLSFVLGAIAQTTVTTSGGSANSVPKFSGSSTVVNSTITDNGGHVGIGTTNSTAIFTVGSPFSGDHILFGTGINGQNTGSTLNSSGGFSSFYNGVFLNSNGTGAGNNGAQINTALPSWRLSLGSGSSEWPGGDNFVIGRVPAGGNYLSPAKLFKVDASGNIYPSHGVVFPDGSTQITATTSLTGPQGPPGPQGPQGPPGPVPTGSPSLIPKFSANGTITNSHLADFDQVVGDGGSIGMGSFDFGGMGFFPDNADLAHTWINQAGPQLHFRLSRAYCDKSSSSRQTASDQANYFCVPDAVTIDDTHPASSTPNKNFMIAPYKFGMAFDYPGVLETFNYVFSVHMNRQGCDPSDSYFYDAGGCNSAAHLSVGDNLDLGGLQSSSYAATLADGTLDRSQSFVLLASETFGQASHGDMLFALRDSRDNFRFQVGSARPGGANDPATYRNFTLARIDGTGKGFFDGGTQTGGADFAESILPSGQKATYEPGDVLVIDTETDRQVTLSSTPYSTLVAGIYSTKPGVVATIHGSEDRSLQREIPMAIIGIVPCKVSAENGPISRGDLLVTSSTPGYAMRATDKFKLTGAIVGKALQPWQEGTGKIEVLITLK